MFHVERRFWNVISGLMFHVEHSRSGRNGNPASSADDFNPHFSVHPDLAYQRDYAEILQDFDGHCHERLRLSNPTWKLAVPVRFVNEKEQEEFESWRDQETKDPAIAAKFKGAPAIYIFSQVYFNAHHTVGLVYVSDWGGNVCGSISG